MKSSLDPCLELEQRGPGQPLGGLLGLLGLIGVYVRVLAPFRMAHRAKGTPVRLWEQEPNNL